MNKKQTLIISILSLVVIVLILLVSTRLWFRADLTKNKSWTISKVSKNLASEISDQVRITYFVSTKLKKLYSFPGEIEDIINEYVSFAGGKITFAEYDPSTEDLLQKMQELKFQAQEIQTVEKNEASFANVFSGILIEYQGRTDVLPFVYKLDTLEYDLTSRIRTLIREKEKTIGIVIGDANKTLENGYQNLAQVLAASGYDARVISQGEEIPDTLSELFVLGGAESIEDWMLYSIDRYIQLGGKVYFAVNSIDILTNYGFNAKILTDKGLLDMIDFYGAKIEKSLVLDESSLSIPMPVTVQNMKLYMPARYPFYVHVISENSNSAHPITALFNGADLYWANPITLNAPAGVDAVPLFSTTDAAWLQTKDFPINPEMSPTWVMEKEATSGKKILAAALSGKFPSFWKEKAKPVRDGVEPPEMPTETELSRIVVVGNAGAGYDFSMGNIDFLSNSFSRNGQPNLDFIVQAADWLSNDDDIISIRNRAPVTGTLDKIIDNGERVAAFSLVSLICTVFVPLLVLIAGIVLSYNRKRKINIKNSKSEAENAV